MNEHWLNINQTPTELADLYDARCDYYWYLRSPEFREAFHRPMAEQLNKLSLPVLDVGCGEGQLCELLTVPYVGLDGSMTAIKRARQKHDRYLFLIGRFEDPRVALDAVRVSGLRVGVVVLGGILEVLVKPDHRLDLVETYKRLFGNKYLMIFDLQHLDTSGLDNAYELLWQREATVDMPELLPEVKRSRKMRLYRLS